MGPGQPTSAVARILGITPQQVRRFVADGLVAPTRGPRGAYLFSFRDISLLRTAHTLASTVSPRKVHDAIRRLRKALAEAVAEASLRVAQDGATVVARDRDRDWDPSTGQIIFHFGALAEPQNIIPDASDDVAQEWYEAALDLEDENLDQAAEAYREALRIDPHHFGANMNLGCWEQSQGRLVQSRSFFEAALEMHPASGMALFNLGTVLEDLGDDAGALEHYERAASAGERDAHVNAARLCESTGREARALRHWDAYRRAGAPQ